MGNLKEKWRKSIFSDTIKGKWAKKSLAATLLIVGITALPSILGLFISALRTQHGAFLNECYMKGEFLLYAISLIASSYTILHFHKKTTSGWWLILLVILGVVYAANDLLKTLNEQPDVNFLFWLSIIGFTIGAVICFYAQYTQQKHSMPDVAAESRKGVDNIVKKLEV